MQAQSSRLGRERINATLGGQHFGEPQQRDIWDRMPKKTLLPTPAQSTCHKIRDAIWNDPANTESKKRAGNPAP